MISLKDIKTTAVAVARAERHLAQFDARAGHERARRIAVLAAAREAHAALSKDYATQVAP